MPYAYLPWGGIDLAQYSHDTGVTRFFGAFIDDGGGCVPAWDGDASLGLASKTAEHIRAEIDTVRAAGGDVAISFGGAMEHDHDLADTCPTADALQQALQSVVTAYGATHLDFDIEGAAASNTDGLARRVAAAAAVQRANPGLQFSLTLAADTTGLEGTGIRVLDAFRDGGVTVASINVMTMDFGISGPQAGAVEAALTQTHEQLAVIYPGVDDAALWRAMGVVVLIGVGDDRMTFSLADAADVRAFAEAHGLGTVSMWDADRDAACTGERTYQGGTCSGIPQDADAFTAALR
jgi:hypothetical protein